MVFVDFNCVLGLVREGHQILQTQLYVCAALGVRDINITENEVSVACVGCVCQYVVYLCLSLVFTGLATSVISHSTPTCTLSSSFMQHHPYASTA